MTTVRIPFKTAISTPMIRPAARARDRAGNPRRYEAAVNRILDALGVSDVRLSLCAIAAEGVPCADLARELADALAPSYVVGRLEPGIVGILYLGPRPQAPEADLEVERLIARTVADALRRPGSDDLFPPIRIRAAHRRTSEIGSARDLFDALGDLEEVRSFRPGLADGERVFEGVGGRGLARRSWHWHLGLGTLVVAALIASFMDPSAWASPLTPASGDRARIVGVNWPEGMDATDEARVADAVARPIANVYIEWLNPKTDIRYTLFVSETAPTKAGGACRELVLTQRDGSAGPKQMVRTLCADGAGTTNAEAVAGGAGGEAAR